MSPLAKRLLILLLLVLLAAWIGLNRGRQRPEEETFLGYLKERPDYVSPAYPLTLYSTNGPFGISMVSSIAVGKGDLLYVGTYGGGLYKSEDRGKSWRYANRGLKDEFIISLAVTEDQTVYAGTIRAGLSRSADRGESWVQIDGGLGRAEIRALLLLPGGEFYVGTGRGIFQSLDGGTSFHSIHNGIDPVLVRTILKGNRGTLYIGTQGMGIFRTDDPQRGWTPIGENLFFEAGVLETVIRTMVRDSRGNLYAGTLGSGVFKSRDGGESWTRINQGLNNTSVRAMAISPDGILYAGTGAGVFMSEDAGRHWQEINQGLLSLNVESMALAEDGRLYVGTGAGISLRPPGRSEWSLLTEALLIPRVRDLVLGSNGEVYAIVEGRGLLRSTDGGKIWVPLAEDLPGSVPRAAVSPQERTVYLVTEEGLYGRRPKEDWRRLGEGVLPKVYCVGFERSFLWAGTERGLYESQDQGDHWEPVKGVDSVAIRTVRGGAKGTYLITDEGLWAGRAGGQWKRLAQPLQTRAVALAVGPGDRLAVASEERLFLQTGEGAWLEAAWDPSSKGRIRTVQFDSLAKDLLFVGTDQGLFWTGDGGRQWSSAHSAKGSLFSDAVDAIVFHPSGVLFVATQSRGVQVGFSQIRRPGWIERHFE